MADLGSQGALQTDLDEKVTTNAPAKENTGLRVRTFLTNFIDTVYAAFQAARAELTKVNVNAGNVTAAATTDLGATAGDTLNLVGTTTITSFGTAAQGVSRKVICGSATPITYNATSMVIEGSASITTAAEDTFLAISLGSGNWLITNYKRRNGTPLVSEVDNNLTPSTSRAPSKSAANSALALKANIYSIDVTLGGGDGSVVLDLATGVAPIPALSAGALLSGYSLDADPTFCFPLSETLGSYTIKFTDIAGGDYPDTRDVRIFIKGTPA